MYETAWIGALLIVGLIGAILIMFRNGKNKKGQN